MTSSSQSPPPGRPIPSTPRPTPTPPIESRFRIDYARLLSALREQLVHAERRLAAATAEVEGLRQMVTGAEALVDATRTVQRIVMPPPSADPDGDGPRGQEAVRRVLAIDPYRVWSLAEITREIIRRGWIDPDAKVPDAAIRAATQRLAGAGIAEKVGAGRYKLKRPSEVRG